MPLHPVIQSAMAAATAMLPYSEMSISQARAQAKRAYPVVACPVDVSAVKNTRIDGPGGPLALRIYQPYGPGPHPVIVFFHGSGFVVLDLDTHDDMCRRLCAGSSCVVVSVDYRLAPEYKFPAAPDDCLAATRWVARHGMEFNGDTSRMAVAGDSAGGCLAAVTALRIRDEGGPPLLGQLMWYPVTDYPSHPTTTYKTYATGFGLTDSTMQWFWDQYLEDPASANDQCVSPLRIREPRGLPSAYVAVAEFDVLRDEGEAFARSLLAAGVLTETRRWPAMNHGFLKYTGVIEEADHAMADACGWLKRVLLVDTSPRGH